MIPMSYKIIKNLNRTAVIVFILNINSSLVDYFGKIRLSEKNRLPFVTNLLYLADTEYK